MTLSPAADHEPPTERERAECDHLAAEVGAECHGGYVEVEAFCPDCETRLYYYLPVDKLRRQP